MATPTHKEIVDNLVASFGAIDGTGDYVTAVTTVKKWMRPEAEYNASELPLVGFESGLKRYDYEPNRVRVIWNFKVLATIAGATEDDADDKLAELLDDVFVALMAGENYKRGGYAVYTKVLDVVTAEYPDRTIGQGIFTVEIVYYRTRGSQ